MTKPKDLRHIYTYKTKLCLARPGDPPMMHPDEGSDCTACVAREAEYAAKHEGWREREAEHIAKIKSEGVKKTG